MSKKQSKLAAMVAEQQAIRDRMKKDGRAALREGFKEFFDAHPEAKAIVWTQYTPYFNDGEACTFSVNGFDLKTEAEREEYGYGYEESSCAACALRERKKGTLTEAEASLLNDFKELEEACSALEDVLQSVLGDHVLVKATRKGFATTEYDHDL